jgi:hypothetical protein
MFSGPYTGGEGEGKGPKLIKRSREARGEGEDGPPTRSGPKHSLVPTLSVTYGELSKVIKHQLLNHTGILVERYNDELTIKIALAL